MKKKGLPDSLQKRKLLFDKKVPRERLIHYGELFLQEGRVNEAAELFVKASYKEGLDRLKAVAVEEGDTVLYQAVLKGSKDGDDPEAWKRLGEKAMELKKFSHAIRAFRKAGQEELARKAEEALGEVFVVDET